MPCSNRAIFSTQHTIAYEIERGDGKIGSKKCKFDHLNLFVMQFKFSCFSDAGYSLVFCGFVDYLVNL